MTSVKFERPTEQYSSMIHINHKFTRHVIPARCLGNGSARPKGFFSFRPKPKLAETAIFLFDRNRYINRKNIFVSAETDTKTETTVFIKSAKTLLPIKEYF